MSNDLKSSIVDAALSDAGTQKRLRQLQKLVRAVSKAAIDWQAQVLEREKKWVDGLPVEQKMDHLVGRLERPAWLNRTPDGLRKLRRRANKLRREVAASLEVTPTTTADEIADWLEDTTNLAAVLENLPALRPWWRWWGARP